MDGSSPRGLRKEAVFLVFEKASTGRVPLTAHPAPKFQASSPTKPFAEKSSPQLPRPRATPREVPRNFPERLLCPQKLPATCLTQLLVQIAHLTGVHVQTSDNDRRGQLLVLVAVLKSGKSRRLATKSLVAKVAGNFSSPKLRLRKLLGTFRPNFRSESCWELFERTFGLGACERSRQNRNAASDFRAMKITPQHDARAFARR